MSLAYSTLIADDYAALGVEDYAALLLDDDSIQPDQFFGFAAMELFAAGASAANVFAPASDAGKVFRAGGQRISIDR